MPVAQRRSNKLPDTHVGRSSVRSTGVAKEVSGEKREGGADVGIGNNKSGEIETLGARIPLLIL
jgi:hypothetical protein